MSTRSKRRDAAASHLKTAARAFAKKPNAIASIDALHNAANAWVAADHGVSVMELERLTDSHEPDGDSRRTEQLIALWHYETDPANGGCSIHEDMIDLFKLAADPAGHDDTDDDMTPEQVRRARRDAQIISDRILLALVEAGYYEKALALVEDIARRRRECQARFAMPRSIPFSDGEQERLKAGWGTAESSTDGEVEIGDLRS